MLAFGSMSAIFLRPLASPRPTAFAEPGSPAPIFKLSDAEGRFLALHDLRGRVAVLYFTSIHCPLSVSYNARVDALAKRYRNDSRVQFIAIDIDSGANPLAVRVDSKIVGRTFPTLLDSRREVARLYSVNSTPQIAVVDPAGTLRFNGPFDDNTSETSVTHPYVAETLATLLANRELAFAP
jgi:peroxiredoxin